MKNAKCVLLDAVKTDIEERVGSEEVTIVQTEANRFRFQWKAPADGRPNRSATPIVLSLPRALIDEIGEMSDDAAHSAIENVLVQSRERLGSYEDRDEIESFIIDVF